MNKLYKDDIDQILLTEEVIQAKVKDLAARVSGDYADKEMHLVAILKGALVFLADFSRALSIGATLDVMVVSSYEGVNHSGEVQIMKDLNHPIRGRHVLLVDDVVDHGTTIQTIFNTLKLRRPASLKVCTLFNKVGRRRVDFTPDYSGFVIPDEFVVGYGLDYKQKYRELPFLATLRKEVYS